MNRKKRVVSIVIEQLDCFGDYANNNPLCAKYCVLRLRCAIEQDQNLRMELLSDLTTIEGSIITNQ
ncbi:MAG: hypothetical protein WAU91_18045 [Desulfatitalea sp.]